MPTPIKSSNTNGSAINGPGATPALNDLMSRLNAQAQGALGGADAESNPQQAFSRWLEKHAIGADAVRRPEPQRASTPPKSNASNALQNNVSASRAAEQALARARQMNAQAVKPAEQGADPNARAEVKQADKARNDQNQAAKTNRKEATAKPTQADKPAPDEETAQDDNAVSFNTAMGEGAAVVRELTPPSTIQAGDPAAMMAWLASLTSGDAQAQGLSTDELAQGDEAGPGKDDADAALLDLSSRGKGAGRGLQSMTLELQSWQGVQGKADAMMDLLAKGGRLEGDPLAGLMPGGAVKASGFGQILNEASQGVRHESATLNTPFGSPEFPKALAEKVSMWVNATRGDGSMTAELHLNPAEMGPINVKIALDGQTAHVNFAAAALETRQAIEESLAMLSSALNDVGLSLTGGDVSSQTSQQAFEQAAARDAAGGARTAGSGSDDPAGDDGLLTRQVAAPRPGRAGGLDLYA